MGTLRLLWGPSHGHGDGHTAVGTFTVGTLISLWGFSSSCEDPHAAAGSLILPCRPSPTIVDPHIAMGNPTLP